MQEFSQPLFAVTVALPGGITGTLPELLNLLDAKFEQGVAVIEPHLSGKLHLHCMVFRDVKQPCKVTSIFERFLKAQNVEHGKSAIKTKRANDPKGWVAYMNKTSTEYIWLKGYLDTFLRAFKTDLKKISLHQLNKEEYCVTRTTFIQIVERYSKSNNLTYKCKREVMEICMRMGREGYQFSSCWNNLKGLTAEVLNRVGSTDASEEWENAFGLRVFQS